MNHQNYQALQYLKKAEERGKKTDDSLLLEEIYKEMADNYLAMGEQNYYQLYNKKLQELQFKREQLELSSINETINIQNKNSSIKIQELDSKYKNLIIIVVVFACCICFSILFAAFILMKYNKQNTKEIQNILRY
ncbi:hypothetical protein J3D55_002400 [Chryseobacterium ginsenosidimutans]|uniref:hypothetical protein n=1 Tax=Chryseobacterium ginsenosidimutans TaxID=687846 RepID=UPI00216755B1|nr:hypothetical protein [Chryseobacterium ginsenosidimutans]MCS3869484.1 hypothetical protein [Chryseobacterium ginsenosidimutans]